MGWGLLWIAGCGPLPPGGSSEDPPITPLRRLTQSQHRNTVEDLFPGVNLPDLGLLDDPEIDGFDNRAEAQVPSALGVERIWRASVRVTDAALEVPERWLPCPLSTPEPRACGTAFLADFGERAFRRPLAPNERELYLGFFTELLDEGEPFEDALALTLQGFLNAPEFLYLPELGQPAAAGQQTRPLTPWELASRLSYLLQGTAPDRVLREAAASGRLSTPEGLEAEAERLLAHPRASAAVLEFHRQWLDLDEIRAAAPDPETFPVWNPAMVPSMEREIEQHIVRVFEGDHPTLEALLLDRGTELDGWLSAIYGLPQGTRILPRDQRAGLLTRAGWLLATSHPVYASPVQRGVFVLERLLCVAPGAPPANIDTSAVAPSTEPRTTRERYEAHAVDPACAACHDHIDPIGFGFERYDAIGRFRRNEDGIRVDSSGTLTVGDLAGRSFADAVELSELLAGSETVHDCVVLQWFRYASGRREVDADAEALAELSASFAQGGDLRRLLIELALQPGFQTVTVGPLAP